MTKPLDHLFEANRKWAARVEQQRPGFFTRLAKQQSPQYMWIGCADSRVPANEIMGLDPGEVFVHRTIAQSTVMQDAWSRGQQVTVHGWVYGLKDGLAKDLNVSMNDPATVVDIFRMAIKRYPHAPKPGV